MSGDVQYWDIPLILVPPKVSWISWRQGKTFIQKFTIIYVFSKIALIIQFLVSRITLSFFFLSRNTAFSSRRGITSAYRRLFMDADLDRRFFFLSRSRNCAHEGMKKTHEDSGAFSRFCTWWGSFCRRENCPPAFVADYALGRVVEKFAQFQA